MLDEREFRKYFKVNEKIKTGGNRTQFNIEKIEHNRIAIRPVASKGKRPYWLTYEKIDAVISAFHKIESKNIENSFHQVVKGPTQGDHTNETYLYGIVREFIGRVKIQQSDPLFPDQIVPDFAETLIEGAKEKVVVNRYERNPDAKALCIQHWGDSCVVCQFNFGQFYGGYGEGFIHVHHLRSLASIGGEYKLDPVQDLRPVCPNCHAMLHHSGQVLSIGELQEKLQFGPRKFVKARQNGGL